MRWAQLRYSKWSKWTNDLFPRYRSYCYFLSIRIRLVILSLEFRLGSLLFSRSVLITSNAKLQLIKVTLYTPYNVALAESFQQI
jgi:hypothetical protein